jgi:hypothetical protein
MPSSELKNSAGDFIVPLLNADDLGEPSRLAAELLRRELERPTIQTENEAIFGPQDSTGPLEEAMQATEAQDFVNARAWLQIIIGLSMPPVPQICEGRDRERRQYKAQIERDDILRVARCALHLLAPLTHDQIIAERLADLSLTKQ